MDSIFPFDVWFCISRHLDIRTMMVLQSTCKLLRSYMQERQIWHATAQDVLSAKPLPIVQQDIPSMTSHELETTCIRAARIERSISRKECAPTLLMKATIPDTQAVRLLPFGKRFISLDTSNGLQLYGDTGSLVSRIPGVGQMAQTADLRLSPISSEEVLLLHTVRWPSEAGDALGDISTMEMRVYRIRSEMELLCSITPENPNTIVYRSLNHTSLGPALVYLRGCSSRDLVACICPVDRLPNYQENTFSFRLRGWILPAYLHGFMLLHGSIAFIGSNRLVLATLCGIYLYETPSLDAIFSTEHQTCSLEVTDVFPLWSRVGGWAMSTPVLSPPITYNIAQRAPKTRACCTIWTGHDAHTLDIPLNKSLTSVPSTTETANSGTAANANESAEVRAEVEAESITEAIRFSTHAVAKLYTHQTIQSVAHGVGVHHHRTKDVPSVMVSVVLCDGPSAERGFVRLGLEKGESEGVMLRQTTLKWDSQLGVGACVVDMSVDELSGRIAIVSDCDAKEGVATRKVAIYSTIG